ncbi:MAG: hypothetical protein ACK4OM_07920 [Alphaproteobacteria bacterium]
MNKTKKFTEINFDNTKLEIKKIKNFSNENQVFHFSELINKYEEYIKSIGSNTSSLAKKIEAHKILYMINKNLYTLVIDEDKKNVVKDLVKSAMFILENEQRLNEKQLSRKSTPVHNFKDDQAISLRRFIKSNLLLANEYLKNLNKSEKHIAQLSVIYKYFTTNEYCKGDKYLNNYPLYSKNPNIYNEKLNKTYLDFLQSLNSLVKDNEEFLELKGIIKIIQNRVTNYVQEISNQAQINASTVSTNASFSSSDEEINDNLNSEDEERINESIKQLMKNSEISNKSDAENIESDMKTESCNDFNFDENSDESKDSSQPFKKTKIFSGEPFLESLTYKPIKKVKFHDLNKTFKNPDNQTWTR